jgi:hypothetical protein
MDFAKQIETEGGDIVKSNYEKDVANYLFDQDIDYIYEKPLTLSNGITVHPDFYLPKYNIYIEVYGMWGSHEYSVNRAKKQWGYDQDDIKVIELWFGGGRGNFRYLLEKQFEELTGMPFPKKYDHYKPIKKKYRRESNIFDEITHNIIKPLAKLILLLLFLSILSNFLSKTNPLHKSATENVQTEQTTVQTTSTPTGSTEEVEQPQKQFVQIATFSNETDGPYTSEPFIISNAPFKIQYDCDCNHNLCSATLIDTKTKGSHSIKGSNSQSGTVEYPRAGNYFIAGNIYGKCSFTVSEYK